MVGDRPEATSLSAAATLSRSSGWRPGRLPRARAAMMPSLVRSAISRRSKWAIAPNTWNTSSPAAEPVSIRSSRLRSAIPRLVQQGHRGEQLGERAAETVQAHDRQGVPGPRVVEQGGEAWSVHGTTGADVDEHLDRAGLLQPQGLPGDVLIAGADARVTQDVAGHLRAQAAPDRSPDELAPAAEVGVHERVVVDQPGL